MGAVKSVCRVTWLVDEKFITGVAKDAVLVAIGTCDHRPMGCVGVNGHKALTSMARTLFVGCTSHAG